MRSRSRAGASLEARVAALMASFAGAAKAWYDPWDIATLFQDSAGTTPTAAAGDPIGRIMDKSGAGNHATQATTTSRPLWQTTYAAFDGTDDSWATPNIDFTSTDKLTVIAAVRKLSDAASAVIVESSTSIASNNGAFTLYGPPGAGQAFYAMAAKGTALDTRFAASLAPPVTNVVTGSADIASPGVAIRVNGATISAAANTLGTGVFGNWPLYIGRRNNALLPFNGYLFGLIVIGRLLSPDELWVCERYMAQQAGITI